MSRSCAGPDCGADITRLRANAKYCGRTCRARAAESRALGQTDPDRFWSRLRHLSGPKRSPLRPAHP